MATVINNPGGNDSGSGAGLIVGIIVAVILVFVLIRWGLPALRGDTGGGTNINVTVPDVGGGSGSAQ
jgi:hypothetical protein